MEAFLETVKKGNLPAMWKTGDQIFQQNRFVPDHATRFKGVPSSGRLGSGLKIAR
jgi:hypothetical protein